MWRASDWVECLIFIGLALMLAYNAFVTVRFFRRYFLARCESFGSKGDSARAPEQGRKNLVTDLSRGIRTLHSIAFAAPFLGLAGTCYGILCLFSRGYVVSKFFSTSAIAFELSAALTATAAGLVVAVPAAIFNNVVRACLEKFENSRSSALLAGAPRPYGFAQTLVLRGRFSGLPAFALIGAQVLAILVPFHLFFERFEATGLPVHLLKVGIRDHDSDSIVIAVSANASGQPVLYVNSKQAPWSELGNTIRSQLKVRPHWTVYVEGEDDVPWAWVANAIDVARGLHAEVVLLTAVPRIDRSHLHKAKTKTERHQ